jgi:tRNA(Arg) A34 adenosine deaminase TadA
MGCAFAVARAAMAATGGGPFGALVADDAGRVVAVGWNAVVPASDPTAHAELMALRRAAAALGSYRLAGAGIPRLALYATCAPCLMCAGAIRWAGIPRVVAAASAADAEAIGFRERPPGFDVRASLADVGIEYVEGLLRAEAVDLFRRYRGPLYNGRP